MGSNDAGVRRARNLAAALGVGAVLTMGLVTLAGPAAGRTADAVAGHMGPMPSEPTYAPTQAPGMSLGETVGATTTTTPIPHG